MHRSFRLYIQPIKSRFIADALRHLGQGQRFVQTQPDVLRHAQGVKQAEVLKHHADAQSTGLLRVTNLHRLAIKVDAASVGLHRAINDFHQGGFARAVLAQDGVDLLGHDVQVDGVIGQHRWIAFADVRECQQRCAQAAFLLKISCASIASTHLFTNILNNVPP